MKGIELVASCSDQVGGTLGQQFLSRVFADSGGRYQFIGELCCDSLPSIGAQHNAVQSQRLTIDSFANIWQRWMRSTTLEANNGWKV